MTTKSSTDRPRTIALAEPPMAARFGPRFDEGGTTAEYAITTLAACGFAALLVVILKSPGVKTALGGVIDGALKLGG